MADKKGHAMVERHQYFGAICLSPPNCKSVLDNLQLALVYEARGGLVVKALRYKPAGRWFDSRWCHWNFSVTYPSGRTMALGSTQPLTEMGTRCISWG